MKNKVEKINDYRNAPLKTPEHLIIRQNLQSQLDYIATNYDQEFLNALLGTLGYVQEARKKRKSA